MYSDSFNMFMCTMNSLYPEIKGQCFYERTAIEEGWRYNKINMSRCVELGKGLQTLYDNHVILYQSLRVGFQPPNYITYSKQWQEKKIAEGAGEYPGNCSVNCLTDSHILLLSSYQHR